MTQTLDSRAVLDFWFSDIEPAQWWKPHPAFDALVRARFGELHRAAAQGELYAWRADVSSRLAEIIVLDQFSRNIHRGTAAAFAADPMALALAQEAVAGCHDKALPTQQRLFLYLPYMHSESPLIHEVALTLFRNLGLADNLDFELHHKAIIDRFDRYPHRNAIHGRTSTVEELRFLQESGSSF